ncbi:MAG: PssE/Cps14G family polysaccharide biosynthesis glycosyltransferase, partial [Eubacteriales bacterium]|nr:PssE/Cps14G family polysaccharide biosynthesis glycosyltransferase [Eubacteriales bacterium]
MIFITLGSQKFQFNRLLKAVDDLIENHVIEDQVFAQSGYSDYNPRHYNYKPFLDREEFARMEDKSDIIITHGGTGAIIGAIKKGKKVIAVPRMSKYGEHVDNHQFQIISQFKKQNLICGLDDCSELVGAVQFVKQHQFDVFVSHTHCYLENIEKFIQASQMDLPVEG